MAALNHPLRAIVRCFPKDTNLTISLLLKGNPHSLLRLKDEKLEKTLTRMSLTLVKFHKKEIRKVKKNFKDCSSIPVPVVKLYDGEEKEEVPLDTPNTLAWREGAWLHVDDVRYKVTTNPPTVRSLELMSPVIAGLPIVPQAEFEFADPSLCQWRWWRVDSDSISAFLDTELLDKSRLDTSLAPPTPLDSLSIHSSMVYWPISEDIGKNLLIQCKPINSDGGCGHPSYFVTKSVLQEPNLGPLTRRQLQTPCHLENPQALRVVSYNILADQYSVTDYARQILYPYCQPDALQPEYRMGVVFQEVAGYHPDVVCMQEVSLKWYENYLLPAFKTRGFDGAMAVKTGQMPEGEAIFFNTSKYSCVQSVRISLSQFLQEDPLCRSLLEELHKAPSVLRNVSKKHTIVQLTLLKSLHHQNRFILVGNTHLSYHPTEDHIRLIQSVVCIRAFERVLKDVKSLPAVCSDQPDIAVVFCGDFNSCPCTGGYKFLTKGRLESTHCNWTQYKYSLIPRCGCCEVLSHEAGYILNRLNTDSEDFPVDEMMETVSSVQNGMVHMVPIIEDDFRGVYLTHEFSLQDSCSPLPYTNYTVGFKAVLDYIFVDKTLLSVDRVIPLPEHREIIANTALPSVVFPSDHLALVCDLKWSI